MQIGARLATISALAVVLESFSPDIPFVDRTVFYVTAIAFTIMLVGEIAKGTLRICATG
jgi:hypothetical protein